MVNDERRPTNDEQLSVLHNRGKRLWIETRAPDQRAINLFFGHQSPGIVRLHRSAIKNTQVVGELLSER